MKKNQNNNDLISISPPAPQETSVSSCSPSPQVPTVSENPVPEQYYPNSDTCKDPILSDNQNKSGIYMFKNLNNGKQYIGSSKNLKKRFKEYFNVNHLTRSNYMAINRALLKHGHSNFSLTIIEYCEVSDLLIREKHYWDIFNPKYNIAQDPTAPMSGRTHSDTTKIIMSDAHKGKTLSQKTKQIMSDARTGSKHSDKTKTKISDALVGNTNKKGKPRAEGAGKPSQAIEVTDIQNNTTTSYDSMLAAAIALNIRKSVINLYFIRNQKKPYKGIYYFKKI